jgi:hypothetical protein
MVLGSAAVWAAAVAVCACSTFAASSMPGHSTVRLRGMNQVGSIRKRQLLICVLPCTDCLMTRAHNGHLKSYASDACMFDFFWPGYQNCIRHSGKSSRNCCLRTFSVSTASGRRSQATTSLVYTWTHFPTTCILTSHRGPRQIHFCG